MNEVVMCLTYTNSLYTYTSEIVCISISVYRIQYPLVVGESPYLVPCAHSFGSFISRADLQLHFSVCVCVSIYLFK